MADKTRRQEMLELEGTLNRLLKAGNPAVEAFLKLLALRAEEAHDFMLSVKPEKDEIMLSRFIALQANTLQLQSIIHKVLNYVELPKEDRAQ